MISIIVGYRNRELRRVKRSIDALANQSFTDFELIFVDYGSDPEYQKQVKELTELYPFVQYVYTQTQGWFWNRAHALNTGVRFAKGSILLFYDIDLIPESVFLEKVNLLSFDNIFYTFSCFYLPEHFNYKQSVLEKDGIHYEQNYVGLCAVSREIVHEIHGYDEYFMVWGAEDDDFYKRLSNFGIKRFQMQAFDYRVFHQWHPTQAPAKPTLWYLTMVKYFYSGDKQQVNSPSWGDRIEDAQRPVFKLIKSNETNIDFSLEHSNGFLIYNDFINQFYENSRKSGCLIFRESKGLTEKKFVNFFFSKKKASVYLYELKDVTQFIQYFIGVNRNSIVDYFLQMEEDGLKLFYVKK